MAGKLKSSKSKTFVSGGSGKMFGRQYAGPQKPSTSATASKKGSGGKFAKGGSGKMFGFSGSKPSKAC